MIAYILIILGFLMRLLPHAPNLVPIIAIAVFSGAYLNKKLVPWVPLAIMVISDLVMGFHDTILYTWGSFIIIGYLGMLLREKRTPMRIFSVTILSSVLFFIITNFGAWLSPLYPITWEGFVACYINAIPFFRNTLAINMVFTLVFFGAYEFAKKMSKNSRLRAVLLVN